MQLPWKKYGWSTTVLTCFVAAMHIYFFSAALVQRSYLTDDSIQYLTIAENLTVSGKFSQSFSEPLVEDLQRTPGYPVFLVLLGRSPFWILLVQHLMVLAAAWLIYRIGLDLYGPKIAASGAKLYLMQPYPVIFASYILSEVPFVFCLLVAVWAYLRFWKGAGLGMLTVALTMLSIASFLRPVALPLLVIATPLAMVKSFRLQQQRVPQLLAALILPILLVGPWMWRNQQLSGRFAFSTMGEMGMLYGRLGGLEAWRTGKELHEHSFYMAGDSVAAQNMPLTDLRSYPQGKQTHETEMLSPGMTGLTVDFFLKHPWDAFRFEVWTIWQMFKGLGYGWAMELTHSAGMAMLAAGLQLICNALILTGMVLAVIRRREWAGAEGLVFGALIVMLLVSSAVWADGRYRMVMDPLILVLALFTLRRQERIHASETVFAVAMEP